MLEIEKICILFLQRNHELCVVNPLDKSTHSLNEFRKSIENFIDFLSEGLSSKIPAFDGVVLLSQSEEDIGKSLSSATWWAIYALH